MMNVTESEFAASVRNNINAVIRLAVTYVRSYAEAEDIAQEVFLRLYTENMSFGSPEHEKAWLMRVTANCCISRRRTVWFSRRAELDENITAEMPDEENEVLSAVLGLPEKYRTVIHLHYCEGYSAKEISVITGINVSTVTTRMQRGGDILRKKLKKEGML